MSSYLVLKREARFMMRDHSLLLWMLVVLLLSAVSIGFGVVEVNEQRASLAQLQQADLTDRLEQSSHQKDWGSAAYYNFHLTYDAPSDFAFAALGQRDIQPWKHRIRMLALEGQIHERDVGNPVTALVGRFDFAFLAAFVVPLILIMLLYAQRANEKTEGRHDLLVATNGSDTSLWLTRAGLRGAVTLICLLIPLLLVGLLTGTTIATLLWACVMLTAYVAFWTLVCYWVASWRFSASTILMSLIGIWISVAIVLPAGARLAIDRLIAVPTGAEILMLQRETVNDAWDLPREVTMQAFFERHPQWSDYEAVGSSFEWPWYYAFQQVGDQTTEPLIRAYRDGRLERERLAGWVSLLAPPALLERSLQTLAQTDYKAAIAYEDRVREFHAQLREFYYPRFYRNAAFDASALSQLPAFDSSQSPVEDSPQPQLSAQK